jgi:hypothetical protein
MTTPRDILLLEEQVFGNNEQAALEAIQVLREYHRILRDQGMAAHYVLNRSVERLNELLGGSFCKDISEQCAESLMEFIPISLSVLSELSSRNKYKKSPVTALFAAINIINQQRYADDSNADIESIIEDSIINGSHDIAISLLDGMAKADARSGAYAATIVHMLICAAHNNSSPVIKWAIENEDSFLKSEWCLKFSDELILTEAIQLYNTGLHKLGTYTVRHCVNMPNCDDLLRREEILGEPINLEDYPQIKKDSNQLDAHEVFSYALISSVSDITAENAGLQLNFNSVIKSLSHEGINKCHDDNFFAEMLYVMQTVPQNFEHFKSLFEAIDKTKKEIPREFAEKILSLTMEKYVKNFSDIPFVSGKCMKYGLGDFLKSNTKKINMLFERDAAEITTSFLCKAIKLKGLMEIIGSEPMLKAAEHHFQKNPTKSEKRALLASIPEDLILQSPLMKRHKLSFDMDI